MDIFSGFFALIVLIVDIYAIIQVLSSAAPAVNKLLWILLIALLPVLGLVIWIFAGPRGGRAVRI